MSTISVNKVLIASSNLQATDAILNAEKIGPQVGEGGIHPKGSVGDGTSPE